MHTSNQLRPECFTALILPVETVYPWQHASNTIAPFSAESNETHSYHAGPALNALSEVVDCLERVCVLTCLFVCVSVCVLCVGGVNVLVALCTPALSLACLDMSIFSPFLSLKWNTPYHSLTHTRAHTHAYTYKKGDTRCTLDNCDTTHTESQITHSEQRVWVVARATDVSKLSIFIPQKKLFHFKVIFNIWLKTRYYHLITKEDMKS